MWYQKGKKLMEEIAFNNSNKIYKNECESHGFLGDLKRPAAYHVLMLLPWGAIQLSFYVSIYLSTFQCIDHVLLSKPERWLCANMAGK